MAVGFSVIFFLARPYGPGKCSMPPKHMSAFEPSLFIQQAEPDVYKTVIHI